MQDNFCELNSKQTLFVTGKFNSKISEESIYPQIIFKINKTTEILHIDFRHASSGKASKYFVWSRSNKIGNNTPEIRELPHIDLSPVYQPW